MKPTAHIPVIHFGRIRISRIKATCGADWSTELVLETSIVTVTKMSIYPVAAGPTDQWGHASAGHFQFGYATARLQQKLFPYPLTRPLKDRVTGFSSLLSSMMASEPATIAWITAVIDAVVIEHDHARQINST